MRPTLKNCDGCGWLHRIEFPRTLLILLELTQDERGAEKDTFCGAENRSSKLRLCVGLEGDGKESCKVMSLQSSVAPLGHDEDGEGAARGAGRRAEPARPRHRPGHPAGNKGKETRTKRRDEKEDRADTGGRTRERRTIERGEGGERGEAV